MRNIVRSLLAIIAVLVFAPRNAAASEPTGTLVIVECSGSGPAYAACAGIGLLLHELAKGEDAFGPNGELMKLLRAHVEIVGGNLQASQHEDGELAKAVRALTGISLTDIEKYGIQGGPNSEFSKLLRGLGINP